MKGHDYAWAPDEVRGLLVHVKGVLCIRCAKCGKVRKTQGKSYVLNAGDQFKFCREHRDDRYGRFSSEDITSWGNGKKRCGLCFEIKSLEDFHKWSGGLFDRASRCKVCRGRLARRYEKTSLENAMLISARHRAKARNLAFDITLEDIVIPSKCPILQVDIVLERGSQYSPSLDRIVPARGYVKSNIVVLSKRANTLKNNMNASEARLLSRWLEQNWPDGA